MRRYLRIRLDAPDGVWHVVDLPVERFCCGFSHESDIDLRHFIGVPGKGPRYSDELCLAPEGGSLRVSSRRRILITGVEGRSGRLSQGSFLRYGKLKISFMGFFEEHQEAPSGPGFSWKPAAAVAVLVLGISVGLPAFFTNFHVPRETGTQTGVEAAALLPETDGISSLSDKESGERADILFIHAHPDDESIDFGALMAHSDFKDLDTALVLFTDGESGIFQEGYAGPRGDLSTLRLAEVQRALCILGNDRYLRLGLKNHPYNSISQEMSPREVMMIWGGEERLVSQIETLIRRFEPIVVVSPDGPSQAREHFEHEAVGLVVAEAVSRLRQEKLAYPLAHLVSVDPRQKEFYPDAAAFPRAGVTDIQRKALKSHATQADASLFAVQMIEEYDHEYYQIKFWHLDQSPEDYFLP
ncbi:PIG-L family deacetylase [Marispirochaeta aestuarii]|uniref:PIG-L deacetylase family protein n=1 Tax=Marispirochaeta aestuarii TaxID=1963862 RepID=UPI0029C6E208|nr:PIG-L family deacetylase [Marispirochaeta aestuarii]